MIYIPIDLQIWSARIGPLWSAHTRTNCALTTHPFTPPPALLHPWYTPYLELCNQGFGVLNASRISLMGSKVQVKVH